MACQLHWEQQMQTAYAVKMCAKQPTEFMCKNNHARDQHCIEPFFLPVLHRTSIQMQGLQSGVSPILYSHRLLQTSYIRSSWNSFRRFREPNSPSLLTKSNHRTLDRSFHNITSDFKPIGHKLQGECIQYRMIDHPYQLNASLPNNLRIQSQCIIQKFSSPAENRSAPAVAWQILRTGLLWLRCCSLVAGEVANVFFDEKNYSLCL